MAARELVLVVEEPGRARQSQAEGAPAAASPEALAPCCALGVQREPMVQSCPYRQVLKV